MIDDGLLKSMVQAVYLNLSYMQSVSKTDILAESSIRYPLLEYVERRCSGIQAQLEYNHPVFEKRRCDLLLQDSSDNSVFEFKYVNCQTRYLFQDYFDDLLRLHYMSANGHKSYLIVCGNSINFNTEFRSINPKSTICLSGKKRKPMGLFSHCLSFNVNKTLKRLDTNNQSLRKYYKDFKVSYKFKDGSKHPPTMQFETRLVWLNYGVEPQSIGIWEVK